LGKKKTTERKREAKKTRMDKETWGRKGVVVVENQRGTHTRGGKMKIARKVLKGNPPRKKKG